jgi:PAS domain S-box-containing protein
MLNTPSPAAASTGLFEALDARAAWTALVQDTNCAVALLDEDGRFVFLNQAASEMLGSTPDALTGRTLHEVLPAAVADERLATVRLALQHNQTQVLSGMLASVWRRATYRPFGAGSDGKPLVLGVCTPTHADEGALAKGRRAGIGEGTHQAHVHDLGRLSSLTTRELEILRLIGEGLSTADIAKELHRSVKTIEWHRVALGTKLGVSNRVELARIAIRAGLVSLDKA